jgi:hypothetical protein
LFFAYAVLSYVVLLGSHVFSLVLGTYLLLYSFTQVSQNRLGNSVVAGSVLLSYAKGTLPLVTWSAFYQPFEKPLRDYERLVTDTQLISVAGESLQKTVRGSLSMGLFLNDKKSGITPTVFLASAATEWQKENSVISRVVADMETATNNPVFPFSLPFVLQRLTQAKTL